MRQRGNLRLLLNANLWDEMAVNVMDGGLGVTFALQNAAAPPAGDGVEGGSAEGRKRFKDAWCSRGCRQRWLSASWLSSTSVLECHADQRRSGMVVFCVPKAS